MTAETMSLVELLAQAGWAMAPIYVCSIVGFAVFIRKFVEFQTGGVSNSNVMHTAQSHIDAGNLVDLEQHCQKEGTPLGRAMATAAMALRLRPSRAEQETQRVCTVELERLEANMGLLSFVAQAAPLFGLLGTVLGMVDLFSGLEAAGQTVDSATLSAGIWKALLTTAAGLIVAIPALGSHAWLVSRTDRLRVWMEDGTGRIFDVVLGSEGVSTNAKDGGS